jgi:hypothetical protein
MQLRVILSMEYRIDLVPEPCLLRHYSSCSCRNPILDLFLYFQYSCKLQVQGQLPPSSRFSYRFLFCINTIKLGWSWSGLHIVNFGIVFTRTWNPLVTLKSLGPMQRIFRSFRLYDNAIRCWPRCSSVFEQWLSFLSANLAELWAWYSWISL